MIKQLTVLQEELLNTGLFTLSNTPYTIYNDKMHIIYNEHTLYYAINFNKKGNSNHLLVPCSITDNLKYLNSFHMQFVCNIAKADTYNIEQFFDIHKILIDNDYFTEVTKVNYPSELHYKKDNSKILYIISFVNDQLKIVCKTYDPIEKYHARVIISIYDHSSFNSDTIKNVEERIE